MIKQHSLSRTELVLGAEGLKKLRSSTVAVLGVGGVGSFAVEALARIGIGRLIIVDDDAVCLTNINRQIIATFDSIGKPKVDVMKERILSVNKECDVISHRTFIDRSNIHEILDEKVDYVIDAIDTVSSKIALIEYCKENNIEIISSMGTGNKLDPTKFQISYLEKTKVCPLAKVMRYEMKKRRIKKVKVLYSEELPIKPKVDDTLTCKEGCVCSTESSKRCSHKRQIPGSVSFVPPVAGMIIAGEVIKDILEIKR